MRRRNKGRVVNSVWRIQRDISVSAHVTAIQQTGVEKDTKKRQTGSLWSAAGMWMHPLSSTVARCSATRQPSAMVWGEKRTESAGRGSGAQERVAGAEAPRQPPRGATVTDGGGQTKGCGAPSGARQG